MKVAVGADRAVFGFKEHVKARLPKALERSFALEGGLG